MPNRLTRSMACLGLSTLLGATLGCMQQRQHLSVTAVADATILTGTARLPAGIIGNNGAGLIANASAGVIAGHTSRYGLAAASVEAPLADSLIYLTDPQDQFYRVNGKMISTTTDKAGQYRLSAGVPTGMPVIVSAILTGNRRVVGFTVPTAGVQRVDLSLASNYVTEFLRAAAARDGRSMGTYDLSQLPALTAATRAALEADMLATPDLEIGRIPDLVRAYALAIGTNAGGLGDVWAKLLGRRVLAGVTVAGTGDAGAAGDGQAATAAELYRPRQVAADAEGNLYVADEGNHRVRRIDAATGVITTVAGTGRAGFFGDGGPAALAQLADPRTIALDARGNLYIGDQLNARVRRVDATTGRITTVAGNPTPDGNGGWIGGHSGDGGPAILAKLFAPRGLAVDAEGNLYIADSERETSFHVVRRVDATTGVITTVAGTPNAPGGFAGDGGAATQARLNYPNQLALDGAGGLLIADTGNHCVRRVDLASGVITTVAGVGGQEGEGADGQAAVATRLSNPYGVAAGADGRVYLSERTSGRVRAIDAAGRLRTVAGSGTDVRDGEATGIRLVQPHDLWVEADGNLLVADTRGSRIRRIVTKFGL